MQNTQNNLGGGTGSTSPNEIRLKKSDVVTIQEVHFEFNRSKAQEEQGKKEKNGQMRQLNNNQTSSVNGARTLGIMNNVTGGGSTKITGNNFENQESQ